MYEDVEKVKPLVKVVNELKQSKIGKEELKDYLPSEDAQIQQIKMVCRTEMEPVNINLRK